MKRTIQSIIGTAALLITTAAYSQIDITGLQRIPPDQIPKFGNFWYANGPGGLGAPPLPTPPDDTTLPIYVLDAASQQYVIDDSSVDYGPPPPLRRAQSSSQNNFVQPPPDPYATNLDLVLPWLHAPIRKPDDTAAASLQDLTDYMAASVSSNADAIIAQQQAALDDAIAWGATNGWPAVIGTDDVLRAYLVSRDENGPYYLMPAGLAEAVTLSTTNVWPGGPTGFNLTGTNVTISMWDEASPRLTHVEFVTNRVTELDGVTNLSDHSTAVAGVLAAVGVNLFSGTNPVGPLAKGMAFASQIQARDFFTDLGEMTGAVGTNHMRLSNQSYEAVAGWYFDGTKWWWYGYPQISGTQDPKFGNYTANASTYDSLIQSAPSYLQVWAAGNDQGEVPPVQPTNHIEFNLLGQTNSSTAFRPADGDQGGYDTMSQEGCAKNVLTVGAIYPLTNGYSGPTNVVLAPFSSCGPTDDGRIKPDVVADGINDITPGAGSDTTWLAWYGGTSFASPGVAGSVGLLSQLYKQLHPNGSEPLASTLKALVIHTADTCTTNSGPSYRFGWGVMNTRTAATLINQDATNGLKNQLKEVLLTNNSTIQFPVVASDGTNPLKITICWTDPAGTPNNVTNLDNPTPKLVNDLDLRVVSPASATNFPWVLNPDLTNQTSAARSAAAVTGDDYRNNVEQVYVAHPSNATYLVQVTHKGNLQANGTNSTQWVSILISGNVAQQAPPLVINQTLRTATNTLALGWPAVVGAQYQLQSRSTVAGGNWSNVDGIISARLTNVVTQVPLNLTDGPQFFRVAQLP